MECRRDYDENTKEDSPRILPIHEQLARGGRQKTKAGKKKLAAYCVVGREAVDEEAEERNERKHRQLVEPTYVSDLAEGEVLRDEPD